MYSMAHAREALVRAAKELLAEDGYAGVSPRDLLERSGAGQGSLYHHFRGKGDLAATALREVSDEMRAAADALLDGEGDPVAAVAAWVDAPRAALRGCRLGRLAAEPVIVRDAEIAEPVAAFLTHVQERVAGLLAGRLRPGLEPGEVAAALVAAVQGGFVLARATGDPAAMRRAQDGALALLRAAEARP